MPDWIVITHSRVGQRGTTSRVGDCSFVDAVAAIAIMLEQDNAGHEDKLELVGLWQVGYGRMVAAHSNDGERPERG